jgi:hypothetical protein
MGLVTDDAAGKSANQDGRYLRGRRRAMFRTGLGEDRAKNLRRQRHGAS